MRVDKGASETFEGVEVVAGEAQWNELLVDLFVDCCRSIFCAGVFCSIGFSLLFPVTCCLQKKSEETGAALVADFTASWCGPCKRIAPLYASTQAKTNNKTMALAARVVVGWCGLSSQFDGYE